MEMSLLHAGLAAGAALAALPVILHLFMRQTPKHIIFPALRLVRERQRRSKKRMRIKNWLLLLARMAVLALMALALARPTLYSQVPLGDQSVPTAMGLVFDTSLSMKYKDKDKTRLEEAKERAREIVRKLPDSSQVFVVDSSEPGSTGLSPPAALKRIDELTTHTVSRPLNVAMGEVYEKVAGCDKPERRVYVLTDLARSAWDAGRPAEGLDKVEKINAGKKGRMVTFLAGLTPQEIHNVSVESAEPSQSIVTQGEPVDIRSRIRSQAKGQPAAPTRTVEFFIDGVKKNEKIIHLPAGDGQVEVTFPIPANLKEGDLHRGEVALRGAPDPYDDDDRRYFTFRIRPAMKVLLISDRHDDANFVASALDPDPSPSSPRTFVVDRNTTSEFQARDKNALNSYACIFLLNVAEVDPDAWGALSRYVHEGGGLVVGAGNRCIPENYNEGIPSQILPAQIERTEPRPETTFGKVADITHPLFQKYGRDLDTELAQVPVYRYWSIKAAGQLPQGTRTLLSYADGAPALLERTLKGAKTGRVLLWTTPLARSASQRATDAWNEFPVMNWSFFVMMYMTVPYMAGASGEALNFEAGEPVLLHLEPTVRYKSFSLTGPGSEDKPSSIPAPASRDTLEVPVPQQQPGQWTVKAMAEGDRPSVLGFSVNPPRSESQFTPLEKPDLDTIFGKDGYHLAEDAQALKNAEDIVKTGNELFPFLMILILIIVTLESFLANTFYKEAPRAGATGPARAAA
jgi:Aerotolerance regulator N-terminal